MPWLGSTTIGRSVRVLTSATAAKSRVFRVAGIEGPDAALTEDHLVIAFGQDVFGRHEPFLDRGRHAPLEQYRAMQLPDGPKKAEVLHVAGTNLQDVGRFGHAVEFGQVQDLGHDWQARLGSGLGQERQALVLQTLEAVR